MSAIVPMQNKGVSEASQWSPEQLKLITDVVARGATPDELKLFLYRCNKMGLDPLKPGQVHFIKYGNSPGTIVVGIEGFRSIAGRTGKVSGVKRGVVMENGNLVAAWCEVFRSDWQHPAREEVPFAEYNTGKGSWAKMPQTMLKKVAEAAALRMAFPDDLGGVYESTEMEQAESDRGRVGPDQPAAGDGLTSQSYCIPYGPMAKKPIEKCDPAQLRDYVLAVEEKAQKSGRPLSEWAIQLIKNAEPLIAAWERSLGEEV